MEPAITTSRDALEELQALADTSRLEGMTRYGIATDRALGVTVTEIRALARRVSRSHRLAEDLWRTGVHEARILASIVDEPSLVDETQMERWVADLDSWDVCDQVCSNLFDRTPFVVAKALAWSARPAEFVKRAGFAMMATAAVHRRDLADEVFLTFLGRIRAEATDDRPYVKKAANWALRQIGKRSVELNRAAIEVAETIRDLDDRTARWIGADALRELRSESVRVRLSRTAGRG